jgi:hypothetical protein
MRISRCQQSLTKLKMWVIYSGIIANNQMMEKKDQ